MKWVKIVKAEDSNDFRQAVNSIDEIFNAINSKLGMNLQFNYDDTENIMVDFESNNIVSEDKLLNLMFSNVKVIGSIFTRPDNPCHATVEFEYSFHDGGSKTSNFLSADFINGKWEIEFVIDKFGGSN